MEDARAALMRNWQAELVAQGDKPLIRLRAESPDLRNLRGTAMADISIFQEETTVAILAVADKGFSGRGVGR